VQHLEFIGDAALNLSASIWLHEKFPYEDEGLLTRRRQCIVGNQMGLSELATLFNIERWVIGKGKKLLPNAIEGFIG